MTPISDARSDRIDAPFSSSVLLVGRVSAALAVSALVIGLTIDHWGEVTAMLAISFWWNVGLSLLFSMGSAVLLLRVLETAGSKWKNADFRRQWIWLTAAIAMSVMAIFFAAARPDSSGGATALIFLCGMWLGAVATFWVSCTIVHDSIFGRAS